MGVTPRRDMGRKALETLARLIEAPGKRPANTVLDYKLVVRDSACPLAGWPLVAGVIEHVVFL